MFIRYEHDIENAIWTVIDSEFTMVVPNSYEGMHWGPFALLVAKVYYQKNQPIAKNIARLLPSYNKSIISSYLSDFRGTAYEKYIECILREISNV